MEIFSLSGRILVDSSAAEQSISKTGEKADGLAKKLGDGVVKGAKLAGTALLAVGTACVAVGSKAVAVADEFDKASNSLQAQTGATAEEMEGLNNVMKNLYSQNFGESFDDLANSLSTIVQQTGLAGDELEEFGRNAMILSDTFDMDVSESTRTASMMMKEFGISGEEAFNLIAQGTQKGLNANDNLLDSINEYSVHFSQMGMSAEEMFNMMSNGAKAGVFDFDKLGDSVKEFGIRVKDGSDSSKKAFADLGFDADEMIKQFSSGGKEAQKAFKQVNKALADCDDKVLQNSVGVALYGTMWEDMGADTVIALSNMNGEFDKTKQTMEELNSIKYDSFSEAIAGIGRQFETGLLLPLGESLLPLLNNFANFINEHMPEIQSVMETVMGVIGSVIQSLETPISIIVGAIGTLVETVKNWVNDNGEKIEELKSTFEGFKTKVDEVFNNVKGLLDAFVEAFKKVWEEYGDDISKIVTKVFDGIKNTIDGAFNIINGLLATFTALFSGDWDAVWSSLKDLAVTAWEEVKKWFEGALDVFGDVLTLGKEAITDVGKNIIDFILSGLKSAWTDISNWFDEKIKWIQEKLGIWRNAQNEMSSIHTSSSGTSHGGASRSFDGSHASGLHEVPYDGYIAQLHKGERVLTRAEADDYNSSKQTIVNNTVDNSRVEQLLEQLVKTTHSLPKQMQMLSNMR